MSGKGSTGRLLIVSSFLIFVVAGGDPGNPRLFALVFFVALLGAAIATFISCRPVVVIMVSILTIIYMLLHILSDPRVFSFFYIAEFLVLVGAIVTSMSKASYIQNELQHSGTSPAQTDSVPLQSTSTLSPLPASRQKSKVKSGLIIMVSGVLPFGLLQAMAALDRYGQIFPDGLRAFLFLIAAVLFLFGLFRVIVGIVIKK